MSSPFVAEIRMFAGNFAPTGWATCDGQLMPISQNTALFSLLGTFYGGDGKSTFALPDMAGNSPMGQGDGSGLSQRFLGETGGSSSVTLLTSEMPNHTHTLQGENAHPASIPTADPSQGLGKSAGFPAATCLVSAGFIPAARTRTVTSPGPGGGTSTSTYLSVNSPRPQSSRPDRR